MPAINNLLEDYLNYIEIEKNRSPKTRESYNRHLEAFFKFAKIKTESDITENKVRDFRLHLARLESKRKEGLKKSTQSYYIIALRNFLKYLIKRDFKVLSPDKIELPKIPTRQIEIMEYNDLERLLGAPDKNTLRSLRDKAILELFFSTGLRISELCAMNRYFDIDRGELSIRGKGGKIRVVFLSDRAKKALKNYLDKRGDADQALFISLTKAKSPKIIGRIVPRTIQRLVNFYTRKAGIMDKVTPHQLRHQFATDLLMGGADLRSVQALLGHSNISTTQIYTHLTNKELREIHKTFHGRRRK
jgi:site-specific recombinase XerD